MMKKTEYIDAAFDAVWLAILSALKELQVKGDIRAEYRGRKRKVSFYRRDQRLSVIITKDGDIEVYFGDSSFSYFWVCYAKYTEDAEKQRKQIDQFREDIWMLIDDFCHDEVNWESVLEYLNELPDATDWLIAYKEARTDWF